MFENYNHIKAIISAFVTFGGFYPVPEWFKNVSQYTLWQLLMTTLWLYQSGGNEDFIYSFAIALGFLIIIHLSKFISISFNKYRNNKKNSKKCDSVTQEEKDYIKKEFQEEEMSIQEQEQESEMTEEEAESYIGYFN